MQIASVEIWKIASDSAALRIPSSVQKGSENLAIISSLPEDLSVMNRIQKNCEKLKYYKNEENCVIQFW